MLPPNPEGIGLGRSGGGGGSRDGKAPGIGFGGAGCLRDGFGLGGRFLNDECIDRIVNAVRSRNAYVENDGGK